MLKQLVKTAASKAKTVVLLTVLMGCNTLQAAEENVRFQRISLEQGLSQEMVQSIFQDSQGFIWFGTQEGLNRYDGYQFKVFTHDSADASSIAGNFIYDIKEDATGKLWIGLSANGVSVYDRDSETFSHYKHNPEQAGSLVNNNIRSILVDDFANVWLGTEAGLSLFDRTTESFKSFPLFQTQQKRPVHIRKLVQLDIYRLLLGTDRDGLIVVDTRRLNDVGYAGRKISTDGTDRIHALLADQNNRLWVGSYDAGVYLFDSELSLISHFADGKGNLSNNQIRDIFQDANGSVWFATDNGLNMFDENASEFVKLFQ